MRKLLILAALLMFSINVSAQEQTPPAASPAPPGQEATPAQQAPLTAEMSIFEFLAGHTEYTTFVAWLEDAGLAARLQEPGPYTVFALSNDAIDSTPQAIVDRMTADSEFRTAVLEAHIAQGQYDMNELENAADGAVLSLAGESYNIAVTATGLRINDIRFVSTRVNDLYTNGVINAVQRVILPLSLMDEF